MDRERARERSREDPPGARRPAAQQRRDGETHRGAERDLERGRHLDHRAAERSLEHERQRRHAGAMADGGQSLFAGEARPPQVHGCVGAEREPLAVREERPEEPREERDG